MLRNNTSGIVGMILVLLVVLAFVAFVFIRIWNANSDEDDQIDVQQEITEQAQDLIN